MALEELSFESVNGWTDNWTDDGQKVITKSHPEHRSGELKKSRPKSDTADQGLYCSPFIQQSLNPSWGTEINFLKFRTSMSSESVPIFSPSQQLSLLCHLLVILSYFCKHCGPRSFRSSLIWVHTVCLYAKIGLKNLQEYSADDIFRCRFVWRFKG